MTADNNDEIDAVEGFCSELSNLKDNNKVTINLLTLMAEDYQQYSQAIVDAIEKTLYKAQPVRKIIILYVVDSIIKNLKPEAGNYRKLFEKKIVDMIVHVFKEIPLNMRGQLFKLRNTWDEKIFLKSKLFAIDSKLNELDKAWTINSLKPETVPVNASSPQPQPKGNLVHVNPKFLGKTNNEVPKTTITVKQEPEQTHSPPPAAVLPQQQRIPTSENPANIRDPRLNRQRPTVPQQQRFVVENVKREPPQLRQRPAGRGSPPPPKRTRPVHQMQQHAPQTISPGAAESPTTQQDIKPPTVALGTHAFEIPAASKPATIVTTVPVPVPIHPSTFSQPPSTLPTAQVPVTLPDTRVPPPMIPHPQMVAAGGLPPPVQMPMQPTPVNYPASVHTILDETPRLSGLPENKKIFLDGKAYEVFYLDDQAVIERNGLPHRVSFTGPPREILIDKERYTLPFGQSIEVQIDGQRHTLRFGAPGRELYMDRFPFKGEFGSGRAPIVANINGRRHDIRLIGPPPEVKIDPDPAHELARYMTTTYSRPTVKPQPKNEQVKDLLLKLEKAGILGTKKKKKEEEARKQRERQALMNRQRPPSPEPIACDSRILNTFERRQSPATPLEQFSMRIMHIRYETVINDLRHPRTVCQYCGISIRDIHSEAYQQHADWHVMSTLQLKQNKYARSNPWLMNEDWFTYSETELVNKCKAIESGSHGETTVVQNILPISSVSNKDVLSNATKDRKCFVCKEVFDEYHDDEEDEWRLRDSLIKNGKLYHRQCMLEMSNANANSSIVTTPVSEEAPGFFKESHPLMLLSRNEQHKSDNCDDADDDIHNDIHNINAVFDKNKVSPTVGVDG